MTEGQKWKLSTEKHVFLSFDSNVDGKNVMMETLTIELKTLGGNYGN